MKNTCLSEGQFYLFSLGKMKNQIKSFKESQWRSILSIQISFANGFVQLQKSLSEGQFYLFKLVKWLNSSYWLACLSEGQFYLFKLEVIDDYTFKVEMSQWRSILSIQIRLIKELKALQNKVSVKVNSIYSN